METGRAQRHDAPVASPSTLYIYPEAALDTRRRHIRTRSLRQAVYNLLTLGRDDEIVDEVSQNCSYLTFLDSVGVDGEGLVTGSGGRAAVIHMISICSPCFVLYPSM